VPWEHPEDELDPDTRIADPTRLPVGVNRLTDPYTWPPEHIQAFRKYIEDGQLQSIPQHRVFQFARVVGGESETTLHVKIAVRSELRYDASSRLYVARILWNDHSDLQAMREIVNQLPSLGVSRYQPLSEDDFEDARMHAANNTELQYLLHYMDDYEDGAPAQVHGVKHVPASTLDEDSVQEEASPLDEELDGMFTNAQSSGKVCAALLPLSFS
jgi:hypothetical protein